jgi:hypothetical protein
MMGLRSVDASELVEGLQVVWMPQRPMFDHGIAGSILEFGFVTSNAPTAAGVAVRLWKHNEYHNYGTFYETEATDRFISIGDLYHWKSISQIHVFSALQTIKGE